MQKFLIRHLVTLPWQSSGAAAPTHDAVLMEVMRLVWVVVARTALSLRDCRLIIIKGVGPHDVVTACLRQFFLRHGAAATLRLALAFVISGDDRRGFDHGLTERRLVLTLRRSLVSVTLHAPIVASEFVELSPRNDRRRSHNRLLRHTSLIDRCWALSRALVWCRLVVRLRIGRLGNTLTSWLQTN